MAKPGKRANIIVGVVAALVIGAAAAAVLPGFFVVRRSQCPSKLQRISAAQQTFHTQHNRYTAKFVELEGLVIDPDSPYTCALDAGHPNGRTDNCPDCQFVAVCHSNLPNHDVWSIASVERSARGETVPAFAPFHDINGE